ncbi:MAG TPA: MASE1 domain-containing protein [Nitrospirales bacterium]|nr:MASE1 domain-containing protein [Nitrospirales bacterium]
MQLSRSIPPNLVIVAVLAVVYLIAAKLGLMLAFVHASATAVWPPTGIALAAFLVYGYRVWPGIFVGAFLANVTTEGTVATSFGIAAGNTLEGVTGAYLVNRFAGGTHAFERPQDVFRFAVLAGTISTMVSATVGVTSLSLGGFADWADYGAIWWTWWLGDAVGALLVAPLLVLWLTNRRVQWQQGHIREAACLVLCLFVVGQAVFGGWIPLKDNDYPLDYLCVPILVWAAFRFGPRETATATVLLSGIALWGTLRGFGPFAKETSNESLLLLQAFIGVTALLAMMFAAVVAERDRFEAKREALVQELQNAFEHIKALRGLLPMCASCKKIRDDEGYWDYIENYIHTHSEATVTHGICPDCMKKLYPELEKQAK